MNGLSLLMAFAVVGIDVDWEPTSSGKDLYTIRIEALVVDSLRTGSAIESVVKPNERAIVRQFRVVVGPRNSRTDRLETTTANEVYYGWSPNDAGGIDYYVQISPERLETLARGVPLDCIVHQDVPAVDKIFVFVGGEELPRKLPQGATRSTLPPRDLSTIGNSLGGNVAPVSGTADTSTSAPRYGNSAYGTQSSTQVNVSDTNRNNGYGSQTSQGNTSGNPTYGPQPPYDYGNQSSASTNRYGQIGDNTLPVPPLDNSRATNYDYNRNQYALPQDSVARQPALQQTPPSYSQTAALPAQPQYNLPPGQTPGYGNQSPTYLTGAATSPATDALAATLAFTQAQLEKSQLEKERLAIANTLTEQKPSAVEAKSSKPLILTTLALFASIGANAYLGWLAWSFFWRFRDAASDLSRARSNAFPSSSLVGH